MRRSPKVAEVLPVLVQDFYSHSNWIELGRTDLYEPGTGDWSIYPEWTEVRPGIVSISEDLPNGWTSLPDDVSFKPTVTTGASVTKNVLLTGLIFDLGG
jgi:hypothetical protein